MRIYYAIIMITAYLIFLPLSVSAQSLDELDNHINSFDYSGIERKIEDGGVEMGQSFSRLVLSAVKGELDLSPSNLLTSGLHILFGEFYDNSSLMKSIIVISILGAIITNLAESKKIKSINELSFYVTYITLIGILFSSFCLAAGIVQGMIQNLSGVMHASIPVMMSMLFISGNVAGAGAYQALMMFASNLISALIVNVIAPVIILGAAIKIINHMTERDILSSFADMIGKGCAWTLKCLAGLFIAVLSIQRISAPIINNLAVKTARVAMNSVPVVGGALSGAIDSVALWIGAAKSGFSIALVVMLLAVCALPVLKLVALIIVYKLTAALIQPVCDKRIVKCINSIGSYSFLLLGAGVCVAVMFIFSVMVLLSL